jgi:Na+-driven multidrug efflux pump/anti-sigma regulatory factor (Ser/Thr protein kinase)
MTKHRLSDYKLLSGLYFRLLPYQVLLLVISAVNGIVDSLYASNVIGKAAMSAIGLFGPLNHFLYAASMILVSGSQILYGRYLARDREKIHGLFTVDVLVSVGVSLLISALLAVSVITGATRILVSQEPDLQMLNDYIFGQAIGIPALVLGQQLFAFLSLENKTRRTMAASIICFAVNGVLNHLFLIVFRMGTFGLGLSTSLASWAFLAVMAAWYVAGKSEWKFSLRSFRWKEALQIAGLGYPGALSRFVETFRCLIVNFLVLEYVGSVGLSSFAASNSLLAVIWAVPFGMVAVARMLFSISIGEEDRSSLISVMRIVITRAIPVVAGIVALLVIFAESLTQLFYRDPADPVYMMTVMGFRILPLCMLLSTWSLHYACYAQTSEKKKMSVVLPVVDGFAGVVLFSFILIPRMGMNGLYISNILNGFLCAAVITAGAWITLKRFPRTLEDQMAIPETFGAADDERIDITVRSMEEVVQVSRQVISFCENRGIDRRRSFLAGLCMEEMAGNIVMHGFSKDQKKHSVDIRVIHSGNEIILRIRDNCAAFNPSEHARIMEADDMGKNVGIRLVYNMASSVSYQNLLGMNVLTMRI